MVPQIADSVGYEPLADWLLNKFTIEKSLFLFFIFLVTPKSWVFHALFTLKLRLRFFPGNCRTFEFKCENRTFHDTLTHFNCK